MFMEGKRTSNNSSTVQVSPCPAGTPGSPHPRQNACGEIPEASPEKIAIDDALGDDNDFILV